MTRRILILAFLTISIVALARVAHAGCKLFFTETKELLCLAQQGETCKSEATLVGVDGKTRPATALLKGLPDDSCDVDSDAKFEELATKLSFGKPTIAPMICVPDKLGKCSIATDKGDVQFLAKASKKTIRYTVSVAGKTIKSDSVKCKYCDSISVRQLSFLKDSGALFIWIDGLSVPENNPPSSEYFYRVIQVVPSALPQSGGASGREPLGKPIPCDAEKLDKGLAAGADFRVPHLLVESCPDALLPELRAMLESISAVDPAMKSTMQWKGLNNEAVWKIACRGGIQAQHKLVGLDLGRYPEAMATACRLAKYEWLEQEEWQYVGPLFPTAVVVFNWMAKAGFPKDTARVAARAVAGLPGSPEETFWARVNPSLAARRAQEMACHENRVAAAPLDVDVRLAAASWYLWNQKPDKAVRHLAKAAETAPADFRVWDLTAQVWHPDRYNSLNRRVAEMECTALQQAVKLRPNDCSYHQKLEYSYQRLGMEGERRKESALVAQLCHAPVNLEPHMSKQAAEDQARERRLRGDVTWQEKLSEIVESCRAVVKPSK